MTKSAAPSTNDVATAESGDAGATRRANIERLTKGQRDCLKLVAQMLTSKSIAKRLEISPHTVDARLRDAIAILQVSTRHEAARILIDEERSPADFEPQRLISQSLGLADAPPVTSGSGSQDEFSRPCDDRTFELAERQAQYASKAFETEPVVSQSVRGENGDKVQFGPLAMALGVVGLALIFALVAAALTSIAEVISRLI